MTLKARWLKPFAQCWRVTCPESYRKIYLESCEPRVCRQNRPNLNAAVRDQAFASCVSFGTILFVKNFSRLLLLGLFFLSACSGPSLSEITTRPGGVLYQDDFSNPNSGWGQADVFLGQAGYANGAYRFKVTSPGVDFWAHPGQFFSFVRLEVDAAPVPNTPPARMGLVCRLQDERNFYFFVVSSDGYYGIGKTQNGQASFLGMEQMARHEAIHADGQVNRLRADCIAELLIFYVNDTLVGSAMDSDFQRGDVGLLAGSFEEGGVEVLFDNFVVYKP